MSELRSSVFASQRMGSSRRRRGPRPAAMVLIVAVVFLVVEILGLWIHVSRQLEPTTVPSLAEVPTGSSGQRGGETLVAVTSRTGDGVQVVTIAVVQVHPDRERPVALVLPRRLSVSAPGHGDLPLADVLAAGGPDLLVRTVQDYTGLDIEHVAVVGAEDVADMASEQGGVDLCAIVSSTSCKALPRGEVLGLLTEIRDGDEISVAEQQLTVIRAVLAKAGGRLNVLLHPFRTLGTASAAGRALLTDVDLGGRSALRWSSRLAAFDTTTVDFVTLPGFRDPGAGTVVSIEAAEGVLQAMRDGTTLPDEAFVGPANLSPGDARVAVQNGTGIDGLASRVADQLRAAGFNVVHVGNANTFSLRETTVGFGPGLQPFADLALEFVPGAKLVSSDLPLFVEGQAVELVIRIGADFASPPTGDPSPEASAT